MSLAGVCSLHRVEVLRYEQGIGRAMGAKKSWVRSGTVLVMTVRPMASSEQVVPSAVFKDRIVNHKLYTVDELGLKQGDRLLWIDNGVTMAVEGAPQDVQGMGRQWTLMATSYDAMNLAADAELA